MRKPRQADAHLKIMTKVKRRGKWNPAVSLFNRVLSRVCIKKIQDEFMKNTNSILIFRYN